MKRKDAQHLQSIPVWAFAHKAEISFDEIEPGPSAITLRLDLRKKDNVAELVVHDVLLVVDGYEPFPEYHPTYGAAYAYVEATKLYFEIETRKEPFPWEFSPSNIKDDGEPRRWDGHLSVRDGFT
jgi:hypothetical protein